MDEIKIIQKGKKKSVVNRLRSSSIDTALQVRTEMIASLVGLTKSTLDTVKLVTSTLNIITHQTEEVSRPAQVSIEGMSHFTNNLYQHFGE